MDMAYQLYLASKQNLSVSYWLTPRYLLRLIIALRPVFLNSIAGFIATFVNIYTAKNGFWSVTAIVTAIMTATFSVLGLSLYALFDQWLLSKIKRAHNNALNNGAEHVS